MFQAHPPKLGLVPQKPPAMEQCCLSFYLPFCSEDTVWDTLHSVYLLRDGISGIHHWT